jgi:hypothetical protein
MAEESVDVGELHKNLAEYTEQLEQVRSLVPIETSKCKLVLDAVFPRSF